MTTSAVVFLDIDGVLNSDPWLDTVRPKATTSAEAIDARHVLLLNRLVLPGIKWVLSSSWRYAVSYVDVNGFLHSHGWLGVLSGATPLMFSEWRGPAIRRWCAENKWRGPIVILDDIDVSPYTSEHVLVDSNVGLTYDNVTTALRILNR